MSQGILSSSEKLSLLLDGELQGSEASTLFYELAQNMDLQEEMKEHLVLRKMFNVPQTPAPGHLKKSILLGAGLSTTLGAASAGTSSVLTWASSSLLKSKGFLMGFSAFLGSMLTLFFVGSNNQDPLEPPLISSSAIYAEDENPELSSVMFPGGLEESGIREFTTDNTMADRGEISRDKSIINNIEHGYDDGSTYSDNNTSAEMNSGDSEETPSMIVLAQEDVISENEQFVDDKNRTVLISLAFPIDNNDFSKMPVGYRKNSLQSKAWYKEKAPIFKRLSLHIRGFTARSIPQMDIDPLDSPTLNNLALGLFYKWDENSSAGIEIGQESFLQRYGGVVKSSPEQYNIEYEQNYVAFWVGLSGHWEFSEIEQLGSVKPILRALVGGTRVGPLARGMLGFQFDLEDRVSFFTGLELTTLFYRYQEVWFNTTKVGVTLGSAIRF